MKNKAETAFLLTLVVGLLLIFVSYLYIYKPHIQKTADLEASNQQLQARVDELRGFYEKMPEYKEKITFMTDDINKRLNAFPADIKEEDTVYLALRTVDEGIVVGYTKILVSEREDLGTIGKDIVERAAMEGLDEDIVFKHRTATYSNQTTYTNLKDLLASMNDEQEQLAITNLAYTMNEEGLLEGSIDCTFYMVDGTEKVYVPKVFKDYNLGITNLFGSK